MSGWRSMMAERRVGQKGCAGDGDTTVTEVVWTGRAVELDEEGGSVGLAGPRANRSEGVRGVFCGLGGDEVAFAIVSACKARSSTLRSLDALTTTIIELSACIASRMALNARRLSLPGISFE